MQNGGIRRTLALLVIFTVTGCPNPQPATQESPTPKVPQPPVTITILHTGDWHGYALANKGRDGNLRGGILAAASAIIKARAENPNLVLALDAGDLLSGHPAAAMEDEHGQKGMPFAFAWDAIGYDAMALGNHEFDHGRKTLRYMLDRMKTPVLCANVVTPTGQPALDIPAYEVFKRGGIRIAVIGLITRRLPVLASTKILKGTTTKSPETFMADYMNHLNQVSDIQIALTHCGLNEDIDIAERVPGLEAIIGGHSHTRLKQPKFVNGVPICHAGAHARLMGKLELTVDGNDHRKVIQTRYELIDLPHAGAAKVVDKALVDQVAVLKAKVDVLEKEILGTCPKRLWRTYHADSAMGGAVANALRVAAKADIGAINSGGLRTNFSAGAISRAKLMELIPFNDFVTTVEVTGLELKTILTHNAQSAVKKSHGILQTAGVNYRFKIGPNKEVTLVGIRVGKSPLDPKKMYTIATNTYIAETQPVKYLGLEPTRVEKMGMFVRDAIEKSLKDGTLVPPHSRRLVLIKPKSNSSSY